MRTSLTCAEVAVEVVDLTVVVAVDLTVVVGSVAETEEDVADLTVTHPPDRETGSAPTQTVETTTLRGVTSATDARPPSLMVKMEDLMMVDSVDADVVVEVTVGTGVAVSVAAVEETVVDSVEVTVVVSVADVEAWTVEVAADVVAQTEWTAAWNGETDPIKRQSMTPMYSCWLPRTNRILLKKQTVGGIGKCTER